MINLFDHNSDRDPAGATASAGDERAVAPAALPGAAVASEIADSTPPPPVKTATASPGLFARLQLFGGEIDALLVPDASIVSDQTRKIVFVVGADNKVGAKPVVLGPLAHGLRVIKSGLKPDDRIVIDGIANPAVRPGAPVTPQDGTIKLADNK